MLIELNFEPQNNYYRYQSTHIISEYKIQGVLPKRDNWSDDNHCKNSNNVICLVELFWTKLILVYEDAEFT